MLESINTIVWIAVPSAQVDWIIFYSQVVKYLFYTPTGTQFPWITLVVSKVSEDVTLAEEVYSVLIPVTALTET